MPSNIQETYIAFGKKRQAAMHAAQAATDLWKLFKVNPALAVGTLGTEDDSAWIGKGHEYAQNVYNTAWDASGTIEKFSSSEWLCWAFAMAMGKVAEASGTYTIEPTDPIADDTIDLPLFNYIEQNRPGVTPYLDRTMLDCAVDEVTLEIRRGPGLANCRCTVSFLGTGKMVEPSGIDMTEVSAPTEHILPAGSAAITIAGTDYVAGGKLEELAITWRNNIRRDSRYYIGSGYQTDGDGLSGQVGGRMEHAARQATLRFVSRLAAGSPELAKLRNGTTGAAAIQLSFSAAESFKIDFSKVRFASVQPGDAEGLMTVACDIAPLYKDATDKLVKVTAKTAIAGICAAA